MNPPDLQAQCELGQRQLMDMQYLAAAATLAGAAARAWEAGDFDTLSRVFMPLQEARRQRRQRAGEGIVCLDLLAEGLGQEPDALRIAEEIPHGQMLVAGWGNIRPALELRRLIEERGLYAEVLLAAVYPTKSGRLVVIVPTADVTLPAPNNQSPQELAAGLPPNSLVFPAGQLPMGRQRGTAETYSHVLGLWERLHAPFLAAADAENDLIKRMERYLKTIEVDYACELAHQRLADTAKYLSRQNTSMLK
jgi:hypothetical protein